MDAKEQFQALQAHLRDARFHLNAGQPARAREALEAALVLDPSCLAAQLLLQQITPDSPQPDEVHLAQPSSVRDRLSVSAGRFEERVRQRRIEGRAALARASLASGDLAAARAAVDEIKELDPQSQEIALLEAHLRNPDRHAVELLETTPPAELALPLAELRASDDDLSLSIAGPPVSAVELPLAISAVDPPLVILHGLAPISEYREAARSARGAWLAAAAAFIFVVLGVWSVERLPAPATQAAPQAIAVPVEKPQPESSTTPRLPDLTADAPAVGTIGAPTAEEVAPVPTPPLRMPLPSPGATATPVEPISVESINKPRQVPSRPAAVPVPPVGSTRPETAAGAALPPPGAPSAAVASSSVVPSPPVSSSPPAAPSPTIGLSPAVALAAPAAPSPIAVPPAPAESRGVEPASLDSTSKSTIDKPAIDDSAASAPAASRSTVAIPDNQGTDQVRDLLRRYRQAYAQLNARSARQVWPSVDEAALARAFAGLESQALEFDTCQIQVREPVATAACRGRASYVPKIGSRYERVEPRNWSFTFRRRGAQWEMESATARRP